MAPAAKDLLGIMMGLCCRAGTLPASFASLTNMQDFEAGAPCPHEAAEAGTLSTCTELTVHPTAPCVISFVCGCVYQARGEFLALNYAKLESLIKPVTTPHGLSSAPWRGRLQQLHRKPARGFLELDKRVNHHAPELQAHGYACSLAARSSVSCLVAHVPGGASCHWAIQPPVHKLLELGVDIAICVLTA